jgi:hypothetical protein
MVCDGQRIAQRVILRELLGAWEKPGNMDKRVLESP